MKRVSYLLMLLVAMLVIPFAVFAQEETTSAGPSKVPVYFFRGDGCPHCAEAEEWFKSIQDSYGSKFEIKDYETWYNSDNATLMNEVAKVRGEEESATGVPYIIIGDKSWVGFAESMEEEILAHIDSVYATPDAERYDVMQLMNGTTPTEKKNNGKDIVALIIILVVVGGIGFGIYKTRENNK